MFTPHRNTIPAADLSISNLPTKEIVTLTFSGHCVIVDHDGFTIGSSPQCDLTLEDHSLPKLHSVIHLQNGAIWIESADESIVLLMNDRPYRRMALRHEDRLKIGVTDITIHINKHLPAVPLTAAQQEDLALLTAEELCDRIVSEQTMVSEFLEGQRSGWEALLRAIESANVESIVDKIADDQTPSDEQEQTAFDSLLEQIQDMNQSISDQSQQLSEQEKQLIESASLIEESQSRAVQHLDEILEKLKTSDPPHEHEFRASA